MFLVSWAEYLLLEKPVILSPLSHIKHAFDTLQSWVLHLLWFWHKPSVLPMFIEKMICTREVEAINIIPLLKQGRSAIHHLGSLNAISLWKISSLAHQARCWQTSACARVCICATLHWAIINNFPSAKLGQ